jgi:hypothetical protein
MKTRLLFCAGIALSMLCARGLASAEDAAALEGKIKMAADLLLAPEERGGDAQKGFKLLVEAIALAAPDAKLPPEFGKKIAAARQAYEGASILDEKGTALLRSAYQVAHAGKEFEMPYGISNIKQATEHIRKRIEAARASLKQGKID